MSRIFAAISGEEIRVKFTKTALPIKKESLPDWVPDAWGVAWFTNGEWVVHKDPIDVESEGLLKEVTGRAIVSHVRPVTLGPLMDENIMPFVSGQYAFAHNGMVDRATIVQLLDVNRRELRGTTDSEALFRLIMQEIERRGGKDVPGAIMGAVYKIEDSGAYFSSLNLVLSNGHQLFVLRYAKGNENYYSLYYDLVKGEASKHFPQTMMKISVSSGGNGGYVIGTRPFSDDSMPIPNKSLLVIDEKMSEEILPL